jgi:plasmid stabilization system protein ParE
MKPRSIVTTPEADEDARRIDEWWVAHRDASNLFLEELAHALALLAAEPGIGIHVAQRDVPGLRRYLLRSTHYHLYFVYSDDVVIVVGLWGATRGASPPLADRVESLRRTRASFELSTAPGHVNRNDQEVIRRTELPGNDHQQRVYELRCGRCDHRYGANGSDIFQRLCPRCQDGAPGLPLE